MRTVATIFSLMTCLPWLAACEQRAAPSAPKTAPVQNPIAGDVDRIDTGVRLAAANTRIDELERKVGILEATPDKLNLELLTQRVAQLELKAGGSEEPVVNLTPTADVARPVRKATQTVDQAQQRPAKTSKLSLPDLERRPRPTTPPK